MNEFYGSLSRNLGMDFDLTSLSVNQIVFHLFSEQFYSFGLGNIESFFFKFFFIFWKKKEKMSALELHFSLLIISVVRGKGREQYKWKRAENFIHLFSFI